MSDWDSAQYGLFEKERTQPSIDLIRRIEADPAAVLDIGCGIGNSTAQLQKRFPSAAVLGVDSSEAMLKRARETHPQMTLERRRIPEELESLGKYDLIFSNACLHWIPDHPRLLPALLGKLRDGGVLAAQMPLVRRAPFYRLLDDVVASSAYADALREVSVFHNLSPEETYAILASAARRVTMWETTYYHRVSSHRAVIDWYKGSGLRPYLDRLSAEDGQAFIEVLLAKIREEYPVYADGSVLLKMPRLFFIAEI